MIYDMKHETTGQIAHQLSLNPDALVARLGHASTERPHWGSERAPEPEYSAHSVAVNLAETNGGAPEWIMLIPGGRFDTRDGRGPYSLSDPDKVIALTNALKMEAGLPIDYDHATDFAAPKGGPAPAAGWIRELENRDGSLWGRVEWTPEGETAVSSKKWRYISPVFEFSKANDVTKLLRAGLTNSPNLYSTAICAQRESIAAYTGLQVRFVS
jgi:phage I-like protein